MQPLKIGAVSTILAASVYYSQVFLIKRHMTDPEKEPFGIWRRCFLTTSLLGPWHTAPIYWQGCRLTPPLLVHGTTPSQPPPPPSPPARSDGTAHHTCPTSHTWICTYPTWIKHDTHMETFNNPSAPILMSLSPPRAVPYLLNTPAPPPILRELFMSNWKPRRHQTPLQTFFFFYQNQDVSIIVLIYNYNISLSICLFVVLYY